jgi:hypothetical protein
MTTNSPGSSARQLAWQATHTKRYTVNFNDPGVSAGVQFLVLPQGAYIVDAQIEIVTPFNAGTTNPLTVGTNGPTFNNIISIADVNAAVAGVTVATRGWGRALAAAADTGVSVLYAPTGTAATQGQAVIIIEFEGNLG